MRWRGQRESENVEDRRDDGGDIGFQFPGGDGGGIQTGSGSGGGRSGGIGIVGILIILALMWLFGIDPSVLLQNVGTGTGDDGGINIQLPQQLPGSPGIPRTTTTQGPAVEHPKSASEDDLKQFVSVVLADTEDVWTDIFKQYGRTYHDPKLVIFSGRTRSACGLGMAAMGPFYCPEDKKVYIDLSFYQELKDRFHAPGDFAQAYVIAHEVGHHVQDELGIMDQVTAARENMGERQANALQVRVELQADCFAGVFANHAQATKNIIEPGDIESALNAASAIGDDNIQKQTQGYVVRDSFTHGSSAQRVKWFKQGYASGKIEDCDTFNASDL